MHSKARLVPIDCSNVAAGLPVDPSAAPEADCDGQGGGDLMLRCGLGVAVKRIYESFAIDEDFFADEE